MIEFGDCRETMRRWADEGVRAQMCVTSPPYFGLRDYGTARWEGGDPNCNHVGKDSRTVSGGAGKQYTNAGSNRVYSGDCICGARRIDSQIGLEQTPEEYIAAMVAVFREVRRVLADDGTLWLNIGDSYFSTTKGSGGSNPETSPKNAIKGRDNFQKFDPIRISAGGTGCKPKDLIGIPWMLAFALRADGWYLRQDIIWHKPNPMPESVRDRCTKAHEYIFLLSKSQKYYYDSESIAEPITDSSAIRLLQDVENQEGSTRVPGKTNGNMKAVGRKPFTQDMAGGGSGMVGHSVYRKADGTIVVKPTRNRRSVWTVTTKPYSGAHFATYPPELIEPCILAGSRVGDTVLDPFMGSGTTAEVAIKHKRKYLGCELNPEYKVLQDERIKNAEMEMAQIELI